jgi:hypothetical protein
MVSETTAAEQGGGVPVSQKTGLNGDRVALGSGLRERDLAGGAQIGDEVTDLVVRE